MQKMCCIPKLDEEYITRMEDVLDVYERGYNEAFPVICIDEKPVVLPDENRKPLPMTDGQRKRVDYEYIRKGTANVFCGVEPKVGVYINTVTPNRSGAEFSKFLEKIAAQLHFTFTAMSGVTTQILKAILRQTRIPNLIVFISAEKRPRRSPF